MDTNKIRQRAVLVSLHISVPSGRKQNKGAALDTCQRFEALPDSGNFSQLILPKDSLHALKQHVAGSRDWFYFHSLNFMDDGRRFLSNSHLLQFMNEMNERKTQFETLKTAFLGDYPSHVQRAQSQLGKLFKAEHYPDISKIAEKFDWRLITEPIPAGNDLRLSLSDEEIQSLHNDLDKRVAAATRTAQLELYRRLFEPLQKMVDRLSNPDAIFRDSLVLNIREVCEVIPKLSLDDDLELCRLVDAARQLAMHDPGQLRDDTRTRAEVAERAKELTKEMEIFFPGDLGESCAVGIGEVAA